MHLEFEKLRNREFDVCLFKLLADVRVVVVLQQILSFTVYSPRDVCPCAVLLALGHIISSSGADDSTDTPSKCLRAVTRKSRTGDELS